MSKIQGCVSPSMMAALLFAHTEGYVCAGAHCYFRKPIIARARDLRALVNMGLLTVEIRNYHLTEAARAYVPYCG